jgi:uncharacterized protein (DUF1778 family)
MDRKWQTAKISDQAHQYLKLASAITKQDMRDLASEAIVEKCHRIIEQWRNVPKNHKNKK